MTLTNDAIIARSLRPVEWEAFREVRLAALKGEPGSFCAGYDAWADRSREDWQSLIEGPGHQVFGVFDGERLVGITGVVTSNQDPTGTTAILIMSYLLPEYRGRGLARRLYDIRLEWVRARPFARVVVSHRASNEASRRANQRHGFRCVRREMRVWPDGASEDEVIYELELAPPSPV